MESHSRALSKGGMGVASPFSPFLSCQAGVLFLALSDRGRVLLFEGTSDCPKVKLTCCYCVSSLTGKELDPVVKKVWWGPLWSTLGEMGKGTTHVPEDQRRPCF